MAVVYTQSNIYSALDGMLHGKSATLTDRQETLNRAARFVLGDIDLRSTKRSSQLSPNLFSDMYEYTAPSDLKETALIDIRRQVLRSSFERFYLVDETEFDRKKGILPYRVAITEASFNKILKIDGVEGSTRNTLNNCNSLTANGTFTAGADASNITLDSDNFITGGGSINFDMAKGAATGTVEITGMSQVDLTKHDEIGSIFAWVFIPDYSDAQADTVTNFILRWGNDSSNYWSRTVTVNNEGLTFYDGWNLLRFDWNGATETGTVDPAKIDYIRLTVTKSTALEADTDWRIDDITARVGVIYNVIYYTKYIWQNSSNTYIENATATTDYINADTEELELILFKAAEYGSQELRDYTDAKYFSGEYLSHKRRYKSVYPTERMKRLQWYYQPTNPNFRNR